MGTLLLVAGREDILRRKQALPLGTPFTVWNDLFEPDHFWIPEETRASLERVGPPVRPILSLDGGALPIFFGPDGPDDPTLPPADSLRARTLAGHGIGVAWVPLTPQAAEPLTLEDAFFYLRKMGGPKNHLWRLFRSREDARYHVERERPAGPQAEKWPTLLPAETFEAFIQQLRSQKKGDST